MNSEIKRIFIDSNCFNKDFNIDNLEKFNLIPISFRMKLLTLGIQLNTTKHPLEV